MIKEIREKYKMTMKQAAELVGIPYRTWQNWEDGSRKCPEYVEKLIEFYLKHRELE